MASADHFLLTNRTSAGVNPTSPPCGVIITSLVKADRIAKTDVDLSSSLGFRLRKTILNTSQTAANIAKATVESNTRYIHEICKDTTNRSNCDVVLSYGDGSMTKVMIRYDGKEQDEVVISKLSLLVKIAENNMTSLVLAEGTIILNSLFFFGDEFIPSSSSF
jgi:hypothetical protein